MRGQIDHQSSMLNARWGQVASAMVPRVDNGYIRLRLVVSDGKAELVCTATGRCCIGCCRNEMEGTGEDCAPGFCRVFPDKAPSQRCSICIEHPLALFLARNGNAHRVPPLPGSNQKHYHSGQTATWLGDVTMAPRGRALPTPYANPDSRACCAIDHRARARTSHADRHFGARYGRV